MLHRLAMAASPTTSLSPRLRLLKTLLGAPHRFDRLRALTQAVTLAVLFTVPLTGLARYDLWEGRHFFLRKPAIGVFAAGGVVLGIIAFYLVTFVLNAFLGRVFCGFGCPIGQASRLGDEVELSARTGKGRLRAEARAVGFALALATAVGLWFVSPYVWIEGSARAALSATAGILALAGAVYLHGRYFRWSFCRSYCPIGVYYSAVQTEHGFGVHFDDEARACKSCNACVKACPIELDPMHLDAPRDGMNGIGIDGFPGANHCLTCGDCVQACEHVFAKRPDAIVPLRLGLARRERAASAQVGERAPSP